MSLGDAVWPQSVVDLLGKTFDMAYLGDSERKKAAQARIGPNPRLNPGTGEVRADLWGQPTEPQKALPTHRSDSRAKHAAAAPAASEGTQNDDGDDAHEQEVVEKKVSAQCSAGETCCYLYSLSCQQCMHSERAQEQDTLHAGCTLTSFMK